MAPVIVMSAVVPAPMLPVLLDATNLEVPIPLTSGGVYVNTPFVLLYVSEALPAAVVVTDTSVYEMPLPTDPPPPAGLNSTH